MDRRRRLALALSALVLLSGLAPAAAVDRGGTPAGEVGGGAVVAPAYPTAGPIAAYSRIASPPTWTTGSEPVGDVSVSLGADVTLAPGTPRGLAHVSVVLVLWDCEEGSGGRGTPCLTTPGATHPVPMTVTVSAIDDSGASPAVGATLASVSRTVDVPYRAGDDPRCPPGNHFDETAGQCLPAQRHVVTFDLERVTLPDRVAVQVGAGSKVYLGLDDPWDPRVGTDSHTLRQYPGPGGPIWDPGGFRPQVEVRTTYDVALTDLRLSEPIHALGTFTASVEVTGAEVPDGSLFFELYRGEGAATCEGASSGGSAMGISGPGRAESLLSGLEVGPVGVRARVVTSAGIWAESGCAAGEARAFFSDVGPEHPFFAPIQRMGVWGWSAGYGDPAEFRPAAVQSRQAMAVFVQRMWTDGEPAPVCGSAPFTDVPVDHPFCPQIAWLKAEGLTTGYPDGAFGPGRTVTRQAGAAFLSRLDATLSACQEAPFPDVPPDHPFCSEIQWLKSEGLSAGYADGTFRPDAPMTRQAMAAWLLGFVGW